MRSVEQFGSWAWEADAVGHLFEAPGPALDAARTKGRGGEPPLKVLSSVPYARGCVYTESDMLDFVNLTGKYAGYAADGVLMHELLMTTLTQHTQFNPPGLGKPQAHSHTAEALSTNNGVWRAADESFEEFLQRVNPTALDSNERLVVAAARGGKLLPHFQALKAGCTDPGYEAARTLLTDVASVALAASVGADALRASEAEQEEEQRMQEECEEPELGGSVHVLQVESSDLGQGHDAEDLLAAVAQEEMEADLMF